MRSFCGIALDEIQKAFNPSYGSLGAILGYRSIYGNQEHQMAVSSAVSEAVEIVALNKGHKAAADFAFTSKVQQKQHIAMQMPDWLQVYVKLETKLPDNGWQNFLNLGRCGVSYFLFIILRMFSGTSKRQLRNGLLIHAIHECVAKK